MSISTKDPITNLDSSWAISQMSGDSVVILYNNTDDASASTWHSEFNPDSDLFMKVSKNNGLTYEEPARIVGEDGKSARYVEIDTSNGTAFVNGEPDYIMLDVIASGFDISSNAIIKWYKDGSECGNEKQLKVTGAGVYSVVVTYDGDAYKDTQSIIAVKNGKDGVSPLYIDLSNEMDSISLTKEGKVIEEAQFDTVLSMFVGSSKQTLTEIDSESEFVTEKNITTGLIKIEIPKDTVLSSSRIIIPITAKCAAGTLTTEFKIQGIKGGASYKLVPSVSNISKGSDGELSTNTISCNLTKNDIEGYTVLNTVPDEYSFFYEIDGVRYSYTPGASVSVSDLKDEISFFIYNDKNILIDKETIPLVEDGSNYNNQILRCTNEALSLGSSSSWSLGTWRRASKSKDGEGYTRSVVDIEDCPNANIKKGFLFEETVPNWIHVSQNGLSLKVGQKYTMSCWVKGAGTLLLQHGGQADTENKWDYKVISVGGDIWQRKAYTFTVKADELKDDTTNIYFGVSDGTLTIAGMKLELGGLSSDWSEYPDDNGIYVCDITNSNFSIATESNLTPINTTPITCKINGYSGITQLTPIAYKESSSPVGLQFMVVTPSSLNGVTISQTTAGTLVFTPKTSEALSSESQSINVQVKFGDGSSQTYTISVNSSVKGEEGEKGETGEDGTKVFYSDQPQRSWTNANWNSHTVADYTTTTTDGYVQTDITGMRVGDTLAIPITLTEQSNITGIIFTKITGWAQQTSGTAKGKYRMATVLLYSQVGQRGEKGAPGDKGDAGTSVKILGTVDSYSELETKTGMQAGDGYLLSGDLYVWTGTSWTNVGRIQGPKGEDAVQYHIHYVYVDDLSSGSRYSKSESRNYVGIYTDTEEEDAATFDIADSKENIVWSRLRVDTKPNLCDGNTLQTSGKCSNWSNNSWKIPTFEDGVWHVQIPSSTATTTGKYRGVYFPFITVTPGKSYRISFKIKTSKALGGGDTGQYRFYFRDASQKSTSGYQAYSATNLLLEDWTQWDMGVTLAADASTQYRFFFRIYGVLSNISESELWVKDIKVEENNTATAFCLSANDQKGNSVGAVTEYYAISNSNTTAPTEWGTSMVTPTSDNPYLWNKEKFIYTDGTYVETDPVVIGNYSKDGKSISSITEWYKASSSSSTAPTGWTTFLKSGFSETNRYLWNYEEINYDDGSESTKTEPAIVSVWGDTGTRGSLEFSGLEIYSMRNDIFAYTLTTASNGITSNDMAIYVGDTYVNSLTQDVFVCVEAGTASTAKWKWQERRASDFDSNNNFRFFSPTSFSNSINNAGYTVEKVYGENPYGETDALIKISKADGVSQNASSRYVPYSVNQKIDTSKTYRYVCFTKSVTNNNHLFYFGMRGYTEGGDAYITKLDGSSTNSAYFFGNKAKFGDGWYMVVGYVMANDKSEAPTDGGVYDMSTGKKILGVTNYKWKNKGITNISHNGTLLGYVASANTEPFESYLYDIRLDIVDGNEPTLDELLHNDTSTSIVYFKHYNFTSAFINKYYYVGATYSDFINTDNVKFNKGDILQVDITNTDTGRNYCVYMRANNSSNDNILGDKTLSATIVNIVKGEAPVMPNLCPNSDFASGAYNWTESNQGVTGVFIDTDATVGTYYKYMKTANDSAYSTSYRIYNGGSSSSIPISLLPYLKKDKLYTVSFYAKCDTAGQKIRTFVSNSDIVETTLTTEWTKYVIRLTCKSDCVDFTPIEPYYANNAVYFAQIKLELGEEATAWNCFAGEERGTGTYRINTKPGTYSGTIHGRTAIYRALIANILTEINESRVFIGDVLYYDTYQYPVIGVSSTYVYFSERISIKGATGDKGDTGAPTGPQILRGTNTSTRMMTSSDGWIKGKWARSSSGEATMSVIEVTDCPNPVIQNGWKFVCTTDSPSNHTSALQSSVPILNGHTYTFSCYARKSSDTATVKLHNIQWTDKNHSASININVTTEWKYYTFTFTSNISTSTIGFGVGKSGKTGEYIEICGAKLEEGDTATQWCEYAADLKAKATGNQLLRGTLLADGLKSSSEWSLKTWKRAGVADTSSTTTRTVETVSDCPDSNIIKAVKFVNASGTTEIDALIRQDKVPIRPGQTYTLSCWVYGTGKVRFQYGKSPTWYHESVDVSGDNWKKVHWTFVANDDSSTTNSETYIYFGSRDPGTTLYIAGMKMELDDDVTDWCEYETDKNGGYQDYQFAVGAFDLTNAQLLELTWYGAPPETTADKPCLYMATKWID